MDQVLDLMAKVVALNYDVNQLMQGVEANEANLSFITGAENGRDVEEFGLKKKEHIELFEKRKEAFRINNQIMVTLQAMSSERKVELAEVIEEFLHKLERVYNEKIKAYQNILDIITKPSFSFEGNEHYKKDIITLKDEYSRCRAAIIYYENMLAYLKVYRRSK